MSKFIEINQNLIDMDEIKSILKYLDSLVEVNHVKRRVIKKDPYSFDGIY